MTTNIVCTACTIEVEEERLTEVIFDKEDGAELTEFKVHPRFLAAQLRAGIALSEASPYHGRNLGLRVEVKKLPMQYPRTFDGTAEQAAQAGWQENEFGHVCPTCAGAEVEDPDVTHGSVTDDDPLIGAVLSAVLTAEGQPDGGGKTK